MAIALLWVGATGVLLATGSARDTDWYLKEFPISFWCAPPANQTTVERYKEIAGAGFNIAGPPCEGGGSVERNLRILNASRAAGIKAIIADDRMPLAITGVPDARERLDAIVRDYSRHPALAGYFITDEPNASAFQGLAEVVAYLREKDPKHPAFINLFPNYASPQQLGTATYEEHVDRYIRTVQPFVVCYDHYHFLTNGDRPGFFANLEAVRSLSQRAGLPFWQVVQAVPHGPYRSPTEPEKRWLAMQTLAFGGKGLVFFTYWTPSDTSFDWGPAIIDKDGNRTPQYEHVKRINAEVKALGRHLLGAVHVGVFLSGEPAPEVLPRQPGMPVVVEGEANLTVGLFRQDRWAYALVCNRSYKEPQDVSLLLTIGRNSLSRLETSSGRWMPVKVERTTEGDSRVKLRLEAGSGALLRW